MVACTIMSCSNSREEAKKVFQLFTKSIQKLFINLHTAVHLIAAVLTVLVVVTSPVWWDTLATVHTLELVRLTRHAATVQLRQTRKFNTTFWGKCWFFILIFFLKFKGILRTHFCSLFYDNEFLIIILFCQLHSSLLIYLVRKVTTVIVSITGPQLGDAQVVMTLEVVRLAFLVLICQQLQNWIKYEVTVKLNRLNYSLLNLRCGKSLLFG